jgi:hypothetical protein
MSEYSNSNDDELSANESEISSIDGDGSFHLMNMDTDSSIDENVSVSSNETDTDSEESIVIIDEFDIDEFDVDNLEQIERIDTEHLYSEKEHGKYYIGIYKYMRNPKILLMATSISTEAFFQFEFRRVFRYLTCYSSMRILDPKVEIMQLHILEDQTYSVVLKTHWLRLIQRHWKKAFAKRQLIIKTIKFGSALRYREIHGQFPYGLNHIPSIWGLMRDYLSNVIKYKN